MRLFAVRAGDSWSLFAFSPCFSSDVLARFVFSSGLVSEDILNGTRISSWGDNSNEQITLTIETAALSANESMLETVLPAYNKSALLAKVPVQQMTPVYGQLNPSFADFLTPRCVFIW